MRLTQLVKLALAAGFLAAGALAPARAASLLEKNFFLWGPDYSNVLPACDAALDTIATQFAIKEERFWNSGLKIVSFDKVREIKGNWAPNTIPRRFCRAVATMTNGTDHVVNYWIGEDTAMIGLAAGVEWCVVGVDRNMAFAPRCKMALP